MVDGDSLGVARERRVSAEHLLLFAGFLAWAVVVVAELSALYRSRVAQAVFGTSVCLASLLVFAVAFWFSGGPRVISRTARRRALAAQSLAALGVGASCVAPAEMALILLVVIAGQVRGAWPVPIALAWVLGQNVLMLPLVMGGKSWLGALLLIGSYAAFQAFSWAMAHLAHSASEARALHAAALAELAGTQAELGEVHRSAERLRIARELHDQVGHQLTGLSLQLEVAANTSGQEASSALQSARGLAKETLADLRSVVGALRASPEIDLPTALRSLVVRIREPQIRLFLPQELDLRDSAAAWALFRCAQEGVTNAVRHAQAQQVRVVVEQTPTAYQLKVEDDGRGAERPQLGNGLTGLRERLSALHGSLAIDSALGAGFRLQASVPRSVA